MRQVAMLALLLMGLVIGLCGQNGNRAADEATVRGLVDRYSAARGEQDREAIARLFTEDADQLVSSGEWRRGKAAMVDGMMASSRGNPGERTLTVERVRFLGADAAIVDARYVIAASAARAERRMWSTFVMQRAPDGWRIAAIRNMLPAQ